MEGGKPPKTDFEQQQFANAFQVAMAEWLEQTESRVAAMEAVGVEAGRVADILDWSFQAALDEVCQRRLGSKRVGIGKSVMLDRAMRLLNDHRMLCERNLKMVMADRMSTSGERAEAVRLYREAKKELFAATMRRKDLADLELFRQIEEKQADSKLFWAKAKRITGRMRAGVKPPPMARSANGEVEADPVQVLKI